MLEAIGGIAIACILRVLSEQFVVVRGDRELTGRKKKHPNCPMVHEHYPELITASQSTWPKILKFSVAQSKVLDKQYGTFQTRLLF